jgi:hypothetical protein
MRPPVLAAAQAMGTVPRAFTSLLGSPLSLQRADSGSPVDGVDMAAVTTVLGRLDDRITELLLVLDHLGVPLSSTHATQAQAPAGVS